MKKLALIAVVAMSSSAFAQGKFVFSGSDTLAGAMTDAINQAGLENDIQYAGGGSGTGEKNLVSGDQNIAPMSRELAQPARDQLSAKGASVTDHVLALDGIAMFVKNEAPIQTLDLSTIVRIYNCEFTRWEQVPGSNQSGAIKVYRRNDSSGTTDAFKHFTGLKAFGACVQAMNETADISDVTSRDPLAVGYAGLSGKVAGNRALAISKNGPAVLPSTASIRDFSYPMARKLYVYEVSGARDIETEFLSYITDRSFMDPIMQAHEFITID